MKSSNVQEKSRGVVIFAFNTSAVDYIKIADHAARLVKRNLKLPVTLITDQPAQVRYFDQVLHTKNHLKNHRVGYGHQTEWRNGGRFRAYEMSPYDETIVIDGDYFVLDDTLLKLLDTTEDYRLVYNNSNPNRSMNHVMGVHELEYLWATIILFKKSDRAKLLFELVGRIQRNYEYYQRLYAIATGNFRNDYAFTIANNILSGYTLNKRQTLPLSMLTISEPINGLELKDTKIIIRDADQAYLIPYQSLHIMDKDFLSSDQFKLFIEQLCQD